MLVLVPYEPATVRPGIVLSTPVPSPEIMGRGVSFVMGSPSDGNGGHNHK